jgi:hypothetical protein
MIELVALSVLAVIAFVVVMAGLALLKVVLWVVLLPIRLVLGLLLLPLLFLKAIAGGIVMLVVGPLVALALVGAALAMAAALIVPLLPLLVVAFVVWLLVRASDSSTVPTRT